MDRTSVGKEKRGVVVRNDGARFPVHVLLPFEETDVGIPDPVRRPFHPRRTHEGTPPELWSRKYQPRRRRRRRS